MQVKALVNTLDHSLANEETEKNQATNCAMWKLRYSRQVRRAEGWESWRETNGSQGRITSRNTGPHASRDKDRDSNETLSNVEAKALVNTLADAESKWFLARHLRTH